jgi:hypothetical protein
MDPFGLYSYECATVITISHTKTARKIIKDMMLPVCSRYYPLSCRNQEFYLPVGETATHGGHEPAGISSAHGDGDERNDRSPNDAESLREYITTELNDLGDDPEAWKEAILAVQGAVETKAGNGDCCDCDELCFYIVFIMTTQELEYARYIPWYANTIQWGREMNLVHEDQSVWKDDPIIKFLGSKLKKARATGYKKCFPCKKESGSSSE